MSTRPDWFERYLPERGSGRCLDVGGGDGQLEPLITARGYDYVNVDPHARGPGAIRGDAHDLPLEDASVSLVVSKDSLEHFHTPLKALQEVRRVLEPGGRFVIWVPWMHPFHESDYYRYSPLGLRHLMEQAGLEIERIDAPAGYFSLVLMGPVTFFGRRGMRRADRATRALGAWLDRRVPQDGAFATAYVVTGSRPR